MSPKPPPRRITMPLRPSAALAAFRPYWYAIGALAAVAFIAYGSYVPFQWKAREWSEATAQFSRAIREPRPNSISDWVANVALGVPLGFCLLGAIRVDRKGFWNTAAVGLALLSLGSLFSSGIEFGQLYCVGRICSGSDIYAQTLGVLLGLSAWLFFGQTLTDRLRSALDSNALRNSSAPLFVGYALLLALVQALPLDLSVNPRELYHHLRDKTTPVPFGELFQAHAKTEDDLKRLKAWAELTLLFLPLGALAAGLPGKFRSVEGAMKVCGLGFGIAAITELIQVLVLSRHPSATDVLIGGIGFLLGWVAARILADRRVKEYRWEVALAASQLLLVPLIAESWFPYEFTPGAVADQLAKISWKPLENQVLNDNYLWAFNEILARGMIYTSLGSVLIWISKRRDRWTRSVYAALVCMGIAMVLEFGQALIPGRVVSPTDALFGLIGGYAGAEVARRSLGAVASPSKPLAVPTPPAMVGPALPLPAPGEPWWMASARQYPGVVLPRDESAGGPNG